MLQIKVLGTNKRYILCSVIFFYRKSCRLWDNVEKYCREGQTTDGNIIRSMRLACWVTKATDTHTHTHTHTDYVILLAFPTMVTRTPLGVTLILIVLQFITGFSESLNKVM